MPTQAEPGLIFEIKRLGALIRVCAIDVASGREVIVSGPAQASLADLERLAARKLAYVLQKEKQGKK